VIIEFKGLFHYDPGDEFTYFYVGKLISEGILPYKDFFFAHPPLQVFLIALFFKLFGFKLFIFKSIALTSYLISALFLFKLIRKKFSDIGALISIVLFLFSYNIIKEATYFMGIGLTMMFVIIGLYYSYTKRSLLSGMFFALAGLTGLYSLILIFVFIIYTLFINKKKFFRLLTGFLIVFGIINLIFILLYGNNFLVPVYKYHLLKPKIGESHKFLIFLEVILRNIILFTLSLLFVFVKNKKKILPIVISAVTYFLFLLFLNKIFDFYCVLLIPFLSIIASYSGVNLYKRFKFKKIKIIIIIVLLIVFLYFVRANILHLINFDFINFRSMQTINDFIISNSNENNVIFGDSTITPMIALYTNRRIAFNFVDTNEMVYQTRVVDLGKTINKLRQGNVKFVIIKPLYGIGRFKLLNDYLDNDCVLKKWVKDFYWGDFLIYDCER
jgi:hypothetical protein